jgi:hypothetical protein
MVTMGKYLSARVFRECGGWLTKIRELPHGGSGWLLVLRERWWPRPNSIELPIATIQSNLIKGNLCSDNDSSFGGRIWLEGCTQFFGSRREWAYYSPYLGAFVHHSMKLSGAQLEKLNSARLEICHVTASLFHTLISELRD